MKVSEWRKLFNGLPEDAEVLPAEMSNSDIMVNVIDVKFNVEGALRLEFVTEMVEPEGGEGF